MRIELRTSAVCIGLALASCAPSVGRVDWEIVFADPALGTRATRVEGRILIGGCTSTQVRYAAEAGRGETPPAPPRLETGRYGFEGRARDATCVEFATGCVDVEIPQANGTTVRVTLAASTERPVCPASMCGSGGMCGAADAGTMDASAMDASAMDASTMDASAIDAGATDVGAMDTSMTDVGPSDTGTIDAGGTVDGGRDVGASDGGRDAGNDTGSDAGCAGCWSGTTCRTGDTSAFCGTGGAACAACTGTTPICEAAAVCGMGRTVRSFTTGTAFVCAIASDMTLWCWGDDVAGQLGQGVSGAGTELSTPTRVGALATWSAVGAGDGHVCASRGAQLDCWGDNMDGQIGFADMVNRSTPSLVTSATGPWDRIHGARTGDATCTLDPAGTARCMGQNDYGQLGLGDNLDRSVLTAWTGTWRAMDVGHWFACGVRTDSSLWCTGRNETGQLGNGTSGVGTNVNVLTRVGVGMTWTTVGAGGSHACAIQGGELWCWGAGTNGRLGLGSTTMAMAPMRVGTATDWTSVTGGEAHTCGLRGASSTAGALYCWGRNVEGQLGVTGADRTTPVRIGTDSDWQSVQAGGSFTCGIRAGGLLFCWGANTGGELGQGDMSQRSTPTRVYIPGR